MIRVAAVGDVHVGEDSAQIFRPCLERLAEESDALLLAGDLTKRGTLSEARVLAEDVRELGTPVIAVLGNHDHEEDEAVDVRRALEDAGVIMLEGECVTLDTPNGRLGIAGVKGFGGGFAGASGSSFGEREMKIFMAATELAAAQLTNALSSLEADLRVALLHYAPVPDTLQGERLEIYPFLGSYLLAEAIDRVGADLVLHGHAHRGTEKGLTPGGVPVRNVAQPVIRHPYNIYTLAIDASPDVTAAPSRGRTGA
jgi:Icc-related predicted phosphoesterase